MALSFTVGRGQKVELSHREVGYLGTIMAEKMPNGGHYAVKMIFDMPRAVIIRVMDRETTFGLSGEPRPPLRLHAAAGA